jgi:small GTP-binding protein
MVDELPVLNLLLLGESGVGKSSILKRYTLDFFPGSIRPTFGMGYVTKLVTFKGKQYKLHIWDKGGGEHFEIAPADFYEKMDGIILIFHDSLGGLSQGAKYFHEKIVSRTRCPILLVHNKADLLAPKSEQDQNPLEEHKVPMIRTSAKTGVNIRSAFTSMINLIVKEDPNVEIIQEDDALPASKVSYMSVNASLEDRVSEDRPCFCVTF